MSYHTVISSLITQRYVSPDSTRELHFTEQSFPGPSIKKRKTTGSLLTPDNAATILDNAFDISIFTDILTNNLNIVYDQPSLFDLMTKCVIDQMIVPFTSVSKQHLKVLGLHLTHRMVLNPDLVQAAEQENSPSNKALHSDTLRSMQKHFNVSRESGCGCIINQYLTSAVIYAQQCIDNDPKLKAGLCHTYEIMDPHVAVFTELPVPEMKIESGDVKYTFHGFLDYALGFISPHDICSLKRGSLALDVHETLCSIIEVKSLSEMNNAIPQIITQVLTMLVLTGRVAFTGVLTNGALWRFFTAYNQGSRLKIFMSTELATYDNNGTIIELLKDMIIYPKSPMFQTDFDETVSYN